MKTWLIIGLCSLFFVIGLLIGNFALTGEVVSEISEEVNISNYSYTAAICNDEKQCSDVQIFCEGDKVVDIIPKTALRDFSDLNGWHDVSSDEFCNQ